MFAAEPDTKRGRDQPESSKGSRCCVYHDLHTHNTNECQELRAVRMDVSAVSPSATIGAMAEEEEEVADDGKTAALAKGGMTDLARITGGTNLAREAGEVILVRPVMPPLARAMVFPLSSTSSSSSAIARSLRSRCRPIRPSRMALSS